MFKKQLSRTKAYVAKTVSDRMLEMKRRDESLSSIEVDKKQAVENEVDIIQVAEDEVDKKRVDEDGALVIRRLLDKVAAAFGVAPDHIDRHQNDLAARLYLQPEILQSIIHFSPSSREILSESDFDILACYCGYASFREFLDKECNDLPRLRYEEGEWRTCAGRGREEKSHVAQTDSVQNKEIEEPDSFVVPKDVFENIDGYDYIPGILIDKDNLPLFEEFMKYVLKQSGTTTQENWEALIHLFTGYKYSHETTKVRWNCKWHEHKDRILGYLVQKLFPSRPSGKYGIHRGKYDILRGNVVWINIDDTELKILKSIKFSNLCAGGKGIHSGVLERLTSFYPSLLQKSATNKSQTRDKDAISC